MNNFKSLLLLGGMALSFGACTSDNNPDGPGQNPDDSGLGNSYMTVSIVPTSTNGTRAEDGPTTNPGGQKPGDPNDAIYEEGYKEENMVSAARFYFFDENGKAMTGLMVGDADEEAAAAKKLTYNYYDCTPLTDGGNEGMPNVEKKLKSTILFKRTENAKLPSQMIVVINPAQVKEGAANMLDGKSLDLEQLRTIVTNFVPEVTNSTETGYFVMSNSVFASGSDPLEENAATQLSESDYKPTPAIARENPKNVYVERTMAKVRLAFDNASTEKPEFVTIANQPDNSTVIKLKDKDGKYITIDGKQVYAYLLGWDVTSRATNAYLNKSIDINWGTGTALFGIEPWNWTEYSRSFWAQNPAKVKQEWISYNSIGANAFDGKSRIYTNENADQAKANKDSGDDVTEKFTKVIIKALLITGFDASGKPEGYDVAEYLGAKLAGKANLKVQMLNMLTANGMIYKVTKADNKTIYTALSDKDVDFVTTMSLDTDLATELVKGRFLVYLQLTDEAKKATWSKSNAETQPEDVAFKDAAEVDKYLRDNLGTAQLYGNADKPELKGLTYYFFPIRHLGDEDHVGYYGVVRNHIYDCKITKLVGLGTPVYDPDEIIYPEKPFGDDAIIAAKINIQSWRVVPNSQKLEW